MLVQAICNSFRKELFDGVHDFAGDTFKLALFAATADIDSTFDAGTTNYSQMGSDELAGTGYTAGGPALAALGTVLSGAVALLDFEDAVLTDATFVTRGALLYNETKDGRAIAVFDFGVDKHFVAGTFTARMPAATAAAALLRVG